MQQPPFVSTYQTFSRPSSGYVADPFLSPIQKKPKTSIAYTSSTSWASAGFSNSMRQSQPFTSPLRMMDSWHPSQYSRQCTQEQEASYCKDQYASILSPTSQYYPKNSRSHLPLSKELCSILHGIFACVEGIERGQTPDQDEVSLLRFTADVKKNDCIAIMCGNNQHSDLQQALRRINDSLLPAAAARGHSVWLTWSSLISHLESAIQPTQAYAAVKKRTQESLQQAMAQLQERRMMHKRNHMQREWGQAGKEKYAAMLREEFPEQYSELYPEGWGVLLAAGTSVRGGGGAVLSKPSHTPTGRRQSRQQAASLSESRDDLKKGEGTYQDLHEQLSLGLSKLDLEIEKVERERDRELLAVSERVKQQMARKPEDDAAAARELARLEAECSLEEGGKKALVAMRHSNLLAEDEAAVDRALAKPHDNAVLIDKFNQDITRLKMSCLLPGTWLNDEVVNFYMNMLQERDKALCALPGSSRRPSHFFNSFFVSKLLEREEYTYKNVKRWTKKFDIFEKDKVFFPVNISNTHWTMMVAFIQEKSIVYYDSMGSSGSRYTKAILRYLNDDSQDKRKRPLDVEAWTTSFAGREGAPQQENGFDCGMFATMYADFLSDDLPLDFSQVDIPAYRRKAVAAIMRGKLDYPVS